MPLGTLHNLKTKKTADSYKPDPVPRRVVTIYLRDQNPKRSEQRHSFLFDLAPDGVYHAAPLSLKAR